MGTVGGKKGPGGDDLLGLSFLLLPGGFARLDVVRFRDGLTTVEELGRVTSED